MMDWDPPRLDPGRRVVAADRDATRATHSPPNRVPDLLLARTQQDVGGRRPRDVAPPPLRPSALPSDTSSRTDRMVTNHAARREYATSDDEAAQAPSHPSTTTPLARDTRDPMRPDRSSEPHPLLSSASNSQDTSSTNQSDRLFTPPASEGGMSAASAHELESSQGSQLLQLSQLAATRDRLPDADADAGALAATQTKRMADGMVKHTRTRSSASPVRNGGHSRNPSAISMASTAGSRIGELSAELKARLSYAMVKVNNGWQSHSIDQVETLASSQGASPTSSTSTLHLRNDSSASPQPSGTVIRSSNSTPAAGLHHQFPSASWLSPQAPSYGSPSSPVKQAPGGLAPPVSIQPSRPIANPRRNSVPRQTPAFLSQSQHASPHTPGQPSPYSTTPHRGARTPVVDPIIFSPHQNVREQDAIESLLFMSSPGNSANLKHVFPISSSQPLPSNRGGSSQQRTALPTSQPRKSLPSGRPAQHGHSLSQPQKRVGFERSPGEMDIDEPYGSPNSKTPRRKANGYAYSESHSPAPRLKQLPTSIGLTAPSRPRPVLAEEDIDRMLDRADESSDSEGEIQIPVSRAHRGGAHVIGA